MFPKSFLCFTACFVVLFSPAQDRKILAAQRIGVSPRIDGQLNDSVWQNAVPASDFIQFELHPGAPSTQKSLVRILYDDNALYVGAELYDTAPDSILRELSTRDNEPNTDLFGILLDTYNDDINAYGFYVTAAGTQLDARYSGQGQDMDWNAVWLSSVRIHEHGWTVEMKIPYSAIRFSGEKIQTWGLNVMRKIRRLREMSFWNFFDPKIDALVRQFGDLSNLVDLKPPPRLSVSPYLAGIVNHYPGAVSLQSDLSTSLNGGMDVKYGLTDAFTLDMTLVPDFSQVQSDNQVLNLSPFEVQYQERRPFFTEGTELFSKMGLFYSRRVGGTPIDYQKPYGTLDSGERVIRNPQQTRLINATKISGRTAGKLGIGLFNVVSAETFAEIGKNDGGKRRVLTSPLTNYNIIVLDQSLNNNSSLSFVNTNVTRKAGYADANVSGASLRLNNRKNTYTLGSSARVSNQLPSGRSPQTGFAADLDFGKNGGNFRWSGFGRIKSDKYNTNDLGILFLSNNMETGLDLVYNIYKPFWKVNNLYNFVELIYQRMYSPNAFWNFGIYGNSNTTFTKRFLSIGINYGLEPVVTADYYEPRIGGGRFYSFPVNYSAGGWLSSDYRRALAIDLNIYYRTFNENNRRNYSFGISPRFRANNRLSFVYEMTEELRFDDIGFVNFNADVGIVTFGRRNLETVSNIVSGIYKFSNRMSLSLRLRHYWSQAFYLAYAELMSDGSLREYAYGNDHNVNFNAFNTDMVFFWQFAPGSELNIVWKQAVLNSNDEISADYYNNLKHTFNSPQNNMLSLKVLYYLDYLQVRSALKLKTRT